MVDSTLAWLAGASVAGAVVAGAAAELDAAAAEMWKGKEYWKTSGLES